MTTAPAPAPAADRRWIFGPAPDLLWGCGLAYLLLMGAFAVDGAALRAWQPVWLLPMLVLLLSVPHYGGTLLRVYEHRRDRRAYVIFSLWATLAVWGCFAFATHHALLAAWFVTLYLTWSPWHYTGQNYGLALVFLRRRGIEVTPPLRRAIWASFVLGFVLTFLGIHGFASRGIYGGSEQAIPFVSLGLPDTLLRWAVPAAALGWGAVLLAAVGLLLRRARARDVLPALLIVVLQAAWFTVPILLVYTHARTGLEPLDAALTLPDYVLWTAVAHAVQYLWITAYYARQAEGGRAWGVSWGLKVWAAGALVFTLPALLWSPGALGRFGDPYSGAALILLISAAVNLHHFILDGAIWKLRNSRVASVLIRASGPAAAEPDAAPRRWPARTVWATAAVCGLFAAFFVWEETVALPGDLAAGRSDAAVQRLERLAWFGRDSANLHARVARALAEQGRGSAALAHYQRALALEPRRADLHLDTGTELLAESRYGDADALRSAAIEHFRRALALRPSYAEAHNNLGSALFQQGRYVEAEAQYQLALQARPGFTEAARNLQAVRRQTQRGS